MSDTKPKKHCGLAVVFRGNGVVDRWCFMDSRPPHTRHLFIRELRGPEGVSEWERQLGIRELRKWEADEAFKAATAGLPRPKRKRA